MTVTEDAVEHTALGIFVALGYTYASPAEIAPDGSAPDLPPRVLDHCDEPSGLIANLQRWRRGRLGDMRRPSLVRGGG